MRYRCVSCEIEFEAGEGKARCPECLRQHGLEEVAAAAAAAPRRRRSSRTLITALAAVTVTAALAAAAVVFWQRGSALPRPGELAILGEATLRRTLLRRGVPASLAASPFAPGPALQALATEAKGGSELERARALARALGKRLAGLEPDLSGQSEEPVRTAEELAAALGAKAHPRSATSGELAVLTVAALRAAGLEAVLAVARRIEAPTRTPDIAGGVTRYLAIVYRAGKLGQEPLVTLDPTRALALPAWAGEGKDPELAAKVDGSVPLDDGSAAAHLLALRALKLARGPGAKPDEAYAQSAAALKAAAPSASLHLLRAAVLAAAGGVEDALTEAKAAVALDDGAAARTVVARLQASTGRADAVASLELAVKVDPGYWPARLALAALHLSVDAKRAEVELAAARKVAPDEPALLLLEAMRALSEEGGAARAVTLLRRVQRARPSRETGLLLYQALALSGDAEGARVERERLLRAKLAGEERRRLEAALRAIDELAASASRPANDGEPVGDAPPPHRGPPPKLTLPDVKLRP
jgi:hypothetical protein